MSLPDLVSPPVRLRLRHILDDSAEKLALKAALTAAHLLGLAAGAFLRQLRASGDPLAQAAGIIRELELKAALAWEIIGILQARLGKIPERRRPTTPPASASASWRSRACSAGVATWPPASSASAPTPSATGNAIPTRKPGRLAPP